MMNRVMLAVSVYVVLIALAVWFSLNVDTPARCLQPDLHDMPEEFVAPQELLPRTWI